MSLKPSKVEVIVVPYDSGNRNARMGGGPGHFIRNGLEKILQSDGHMVSVATIAIESGFTAEVQTQFQLYSMLAGCVAEAHRNGKFPLVLSGNCGAALGAMAGMTTKRSGLIWFDAHGDFNTPDTSLSGFLDGMVLSVAAGRCWKKLALSIPNFSALAGSCILHIGGRDFDAEEEKMLDQAGVAVVHAAAIQDKHVPDALLPAISRLVGSTEAAHLHIDLDVLDPRQAPANEFTTDAGGLSADQVSEAIGLIMENLKIASATIAAFDPNCDPDGKTLQIGIELMRRVLYNRFLR